jgi:hypothetical protein
MAFRVRRRSSREAILAIHTLDPLEVVGEIFAQNLT